MARKTLLTESEIRRFMKLARMNPLGKGRMQEYGAYPGARDEDEELESELGATEDELGAEDAFAGEEGEELDVEGGEDLSGELEDMLATGVEALAAAWGIEDRVDVEGGEEVEVEDDVEMDMGPEGGEEFALSAEEEVEEPMMEGDPALAQGTTRVHPECRGLTGADYDECVKAQGQKPGFQASTRSRASRERGQYSGPTMKGVTAEGTKKGERTEDDEEAYGSPSKREKKTTSGRGRGEKKGDEAYINEDSGEEEGEHYEHNREADDAHIAAIEHHLEALKHDRDYDTEHVDENRRHDAIVNEVARRVARRLAKKSQKEAMADQLAERILKRLTK